ncbi:MAG: cell division protein FtsZ [Verrucomicrobia bacterium]|nr:cell division protein FtsZ [Verrucomicrobiota bacterium]
MALEFVNTHERGARIKVIGIGGAGCNALNKMIASDIEGVDYIAVNTDMQALSTCMARERLQIGRNVTFGLGAGGDPELGRKAAEEDEDAIIEILEDAEIVFLTAGLGGGTGTGATPVIARIARDRGILTIAIVTKPFLFEGSIKQRYADDGLATLRSTIETVMTIPNQRLFEIAGTNLTIVEAFRITDQVLCRSVSAISTLILKPGMMNLDFAHIRTVMSIKGAAVLGFGEGHGPDKAMQAMREAIASPMMEQTEVAGAKGVLISLTCSADLKLHELNEATQIIREIAAPDANIIFGYNVEEEMQDSAVITLIATGLDDKAEPSAARAAERAKKKAERNVPDLFQEPAEPGSKPIAAAKTDRVLYRGEDLEEPAFLRRKRREHLG